MSEKLSFLPVNKTGDFQTVSPSEVTAKYFNYPSGDGWRKIEALLYLALNEGHLCAYTMLRDKFFRIPASYWKQYGLLTGQLADELMSLGGDFCYPAEYEGAPVLFFQDEIDSWVEGKAASFPLGYPRDAEPRAGLWTELTTMAWICSRDRWFTAAVQKYEVDVYADRGGPHSAFAWRRISDAADVYFPCDGGNPLLAAESELREKLELGNLGLVGFNTMTEQTETIERARFADWNRLFQSNGLEFIPGYLRLRAASSDVLRLWPEPDGSEQPAALKAAAPAPVSDDEFAGWMAGLPAVVRETASRPFIVDWFERTHPGKKVGPTQAKKLTRGRDVPNRKPTTNERATWDAAMRQCVG
ncbi:hypothetical protein [Parasphingorhabdus flavimaris]|uniref:hypothetical protein n=1 Tax=Parasphingorhabdus flavimaris TaxID=266812 RepID=UPI003003970E